MRVPHATRRSLRRVSVLLMLGGLLTLGTGSALGQGAGKGQPAAAAGSSAAAPKCTLRPSGHASSRDEWASCVSVTANISRVPAIGETATVSFTVLADVARNARILVDLPSNLEFVGVPAGMRIGPARSSVAGQRVSRASERRSLAADKPQRLQVQVRALAPGAGQIRVRAVARTDYGADAGSDSVFLTVGRTAAESKLGIDVPEVAGTAAVAPGAVSKRAATNGTPKAAPLDGTMSVKVKRNALGAACAVGSWHYTHNTGVLRPSINYQVEAWNDDSFTGDNFLGQVSTDSSGNYSICFNNVDSDFGDSGTVDLYVRFVSANSLWRVRRTGTNDNFVFQTETVFDIPDGNHSFGARQPGDANLMGGSQVFDRINDAWFWIPSFCWDPGESPCRQLIANWAPDSTDGTYYSTGSNDVHLDANDHIGNYLVVHEAFHAIMDDNYNDAFPPAACGNPHFLQTQYDQGCAWTEGWADWAPLDVYNTNTLTWDDGSSLEMESPTWGTGGWDTGDDVEGRVAAALMDIADFAGETWDGYGEGAPGNIWTTFTTNVSNTFPIYWNQRGAGGFNVASAGALGSVYQNTIDYGYRDPLANYVEKIRPTPSPNVHNYSYNTNSPYWSAVAIRPPAGVDYDMTLYDDFGQTASLAGSTFGGNTIDFISVDSNRRALGDYYPRVFHFAGAGNYLVELAQGSDQLSEGSQAVFMGSNDVIVIRDSFLGAGLNNGFRVVPSNGGQDPELFLMQSDATSTTWIRSRGSATASSTANGAGIAEQFTYTDPESEWVGIVLTNKAGSGTYTLYRDSSAPAGSVSINSGAAMTNNPNVTLSLSASDAQTGIEAMRISTDGALDSEPWIAFAGSANRTLPAPDGNKTVLAQFRNNAGLVSATASDSILLDTVGPTITLPPHQSFQANTTATNTTVPVRTTWAATDGGSGLCSFTLFRRDTPAGAFVAQPGLPAAPLDTSASQQLAGGFHQYRLRATDCVGNFTNINGRGATLTILQETPGPIAYSAGWTQLTNSNAMAGGLRQTNQTDRTATFSYNGRSVAWGGRRDPDSGLATLKLDAGAPTNVNLENAAVQHRRLVAVKNPGLGAHTIVINNINTPTEPNKITLDFIAWLDN